MRVVGGVGGSATPDLFVGSWTIAIPACVGTVAVDPCMPMAYLYNNRLDGATGDLLDSATIQRSFGPSRYGIWFQLFVPEADRDGDGVVDEILNAGSFDVDGARTLAIHQSTRDGKVLYEAPQEGYTLLTDLAWMRPRDIDGDPGSDIAVVHRDFDPATGTLSNSTYDAVGMPSGKPLWRWGFTSTGLSLGGQQDGVGGEELVLSRATVDGDGFRHRTLESVYGADLSTRWTVELAVTGS